MHQCLISIGSNYNRKENLTFARQKLSESFPSIRFMPEQETAPLLLKNKAMFSNQVAVFLSEAVEEDIEKVLKNIERFAGRRPEDKSLEKVRLDIDLIAYDDRILRPDDWQREYIQQSISSINHSLSTKEE